jgi:peptidoglycan/LPS O-acetylase OafA/YrhL
VPAFTGFAKRPDESVFQRPFRYIVARTSCDVLNTGPLHLLARHDFRLNDGLGTWGSCLTQTDLTVEAATAAPSEQNMPAKARITSGDIPVLNGIRGLLALWVLLGHVHIFCGGQLPFLSTPGMAVYAFMVMSGFLMALHFRLREQREPWQNPRTWWVFYLRRFFRIAPLYYLLLAFALTFHGPYMAAYYNLGRFYLPDFVPAAGVPTYDLFGFDFATLFYHATFLFGAIPSQSSNNILPDWSIGLEMQFYQVFPFLMIALRKIGPVWFAACALAVIFAAHPLERQFPLPSFLPLVLTAFVIGIFMSEAWFTKDKMTASALLVVAIFLASVRMPAKFQAIPLAMIFLINFPELFGRLKIKRLGTAVLNSLGGRLGLFLGDRSYSVYLLHMLILVPVLTLVEGMPWFEHSTPLVRFAVVAPVMLVTCYALATITLMAVENPFIAMGRRFTALSSAYFQSSSSSRPSAFEHRQ